ncbi:hypothetical protein FE275_19435 [Pseudomonas koreensis]|uniref:hypothetical protein n=1 Tax=Pseudomonas koreensis TaxID=198620 RepID=UPI00123A1D00|nr:hypothetical protein [Pseudomonas koreensis]KAA8739140.1 hypothetical protein FE275_19435 [Pseudomonas koreensis]
MSYVSRTLIVKALGFRVNRNTPEEWVPQKIEETLKVISKNSPTIGGRHYPEVHNIEKGSSCYFINRIKNSGVNGCVFDVCAYIHGHVPESMSPDLSKSEADIKAVVLTGDDGRPGELVHTYRCIALGEIIIVESVKGGGGTAGLATLLTALMRRFVNPRHPAVEFSDIGSADLKRLIASQGGVSKVSAKLLQETSTRGSTFGHLLSSIRGKVPGANKCLVSWEAEDKTLGADEAIKMLQESDDDSLSSVTLYFKNGGSISDLNKYRERKPVRIQLVDDGRPAVTEIEVELKKYLNDLRDPKKPGPIKSDGTLKAVKKLSEE